MSDFGDFDPADAWDTEPADPEQSIRRLHRLRSFFEEMIGNPPLPPFDTLDSGERARLMETGAMMVDWLNTHPADSYELAYAVHEFRRSRSPGLPDWDGLPEDHRQIADALMTLVIVWLRRQGALA